MGSTGLLGVPLKEHLRDVGFHVVTLSRTGESDLKVDAANKTDLFAVLSGQSFDSVINLIGLTSVELCEENPSLAHRINGLAVENIVSWISSCSPLTHLVHISTDQVYDGIGPHKEPEITLVNTYAQSKHTGEIASGRISSTVLRTNFVGKSRTSGRESLTDWLYVSLERGENIQVLRDVLFSPVCISTLCSVLTHVLDMKPIGTFNLGSSGGMSKADFDFEFARALSLPEELMSPVFAHDAKFLRAKRPLDMRMDSSKLEKELGIKLPSLREEIRKVAQEYETK